MPKERWGGKMPSKLKVASFFSGIGGFDLGLEHAGMKVVFQCETNEKYGELISERLPRWILIENVP